MAESVISRGQKPIIIVRPETDGMTALGNLRHLGVTVVMDGISKSSIALGKFLKDVDNLGMKAVVRIDQDLVLPIFMAKKDANYCESEIGSEARERASLLKRASIIAVRANDPITHSYSGTDAGRSAFLNGSQDLGSQLLIMRTIGFDRNWMAPWLNLGGIDGLRVLFADKPRIATDVSKKNASSFAYKVDWEGFEEAVQNASRHGITVGLNQVGLRQNDHPRDSREIEENSIKAISKGASFVMVQHGKEGLDSNALYRLLKRYD